MIRGLPWSPTNPTIVPPPCSIVNSPQFRTIVVVLLLPPHVPRLRSTVGERVVGPEQHNVVGPWCGGVGVPHNRNAIAGVSIPLGVDRSTVSEVGTLPGNCKNKIREANYSKVNSNRTYCGFHRSCDTQKEVTFSQEKSNLCATVAVTGHGLAPHRMSGAPIPVPCQRLFA